METSQIRQSIEDLSERVAFLDRKLEQFTRVFEPGPQLVECLDDPFQPGALLAERLRPVGFVPDVRVLQLPADFGQSVGLALVVKGTPLTRLRVH